MRLCLAMTTFTDSQLLIQLIYTARPRASFWVGPLRTLNESPHSTSPSPIRGDDTLLLHPLDPSHQLLSSKSAVSPDLCLALDRHQQLSLVDSFHDNRTIFECIGYRSRRVSSKSSLTKYRSPPPHATRHPPQVHHRLA
jgi:hypothetical protein